MHRPSGVVRARSNRIAQPEQSETLATCPHWGASCFSPPRELEPVPRRHIRGAAHAADGGELRRVDVHALVRERIVDAHMHHAAESASRRRSPSSTRSSSPKPRSKASSASSASSATARPAACARRSTTRSPRRAARSSPTSWRTSPSALDRCSTHQRKPPQRRPLHIRGGCPHGRPVTGRGVSRPSTRPSLRVGVTRLETQVDSARSRSVPARPPLPATVHRHPSCRALPSHLDSPPRPPQAPPAGSRRCRRARGSKAVRAARP
jgi:hypothetical protein